MLSKSKKLEILKEIKRNRLSIYDNQDEKILDDEVLTNLIDYISGDEINLTAIIEAIRFNGLIDTFKDADEFYKQYKKIIEKDENKRKIFYKRFRIITDLKNKNPYPDEFYNEQLRQELLEKQNFKCGICNKDISFCYPPLHHISYDKSDCSKNNLIFLCARCHGKTNFNRDFWKNVLLEKNNGI